MRSTSQLDLQGYHCDSTEWTKCSDDDAVARFLRDSWGAPGLRTLEASGRQGDVLQVLPTALSEDWSIGEATNGRLYVRNEILLAWAHIREAFTEEERCVYLTGEPGSGTTFSLLYVLRRCLAEERPVMLSPYGGTTYLFTAQGVYAARTASLECADLPYTPDFEPEKRVWSLVDGDAVTSAAVRSKSLLFTVCASAPGADEYWAKSWAPRAIMEPWARDELRECMTLFTQLQHISDEQISTAAAKSGPTPRAVLRYLHNPVAYAAGRAAALADVVSPSALREFIRDTMLRCPDNAIADSHRLFVLHRWRVPFNGLVRQCAHLPIVDVLDGAVLEALRQRFEDLDHQTALGLLGECGSAPEASRLAAWLYEIVACAVLSGTAALSRGEIDEFYKIQSRLTAGHDVFTGAL